MMYQLPEPPLHSKEFHHRPCHMSASSGWSKSQCGGRCCLQPGSDSSITSGSRTATARDVRPGLAARHEYPWTSTPGTTRRLLARPGWSDLIGDRPAPCMPPPFRFLLRRPAEGSVTCSALQPFVRPSAVPPPRPAQHPRARPAQPPSAEHVRQPRTTRRRWRRSDGRARSSRSRSTTIGSRRCRPTTRVPPSACLSSRRTAPRPARAARPPRSARRRWR